MPEHNGVQIPEAREKGKRVLLIILALVVLGGGGAFLALKNAGAPRDATSKEASPTERIKSMMYLDAFLVNLADAEDARFLKVTFRLGLDRENLGEEYAEDPIILAATRDRILALLSTKTAEEMLSPEGKERLRAEIRDKVNPIFPKGKIVEVFILDFVVQL